jgi:hypothetical protein
MNPPYDIANEEAAMDELREHEERDSPIARLLNEAIQVAFRLGREDDAEGLKEHLVECLALVAEQQTAGYIKNKQPQKGKATR